MSRQGLHMRNTNNNHRNTQRGHPIATISIRNESLNMPFLSRCDYGPKLRINSTGCHNARMLTEKNARMTLRSSQCNTCCSQLSNHVSSVTVRAEAYLTNSRRCTIAIYACRHVHTARIMRVQKLKHESIEHALR
jgi:hypothetical protein